MDKRSHVAAAAVHLALLGAAFGGCGWSMSEPFVWPAETKREYSAWSRAEQRRQYAAWVARENHRTQNRIRRRVQKEKRG